MANLAILAVVVGTFVYLSFHCRFTSCHHESVTRAVPHFSSISEVDRINLSEAIVIGHIESISGFRWNQNSGLSWTMPTASSHQAPTAIAILPPAAFPLFEVAMTISELPIDRLGIGEQITFSMLGTSPQDIQHGNAKDVLKRGNHVLVMLARQEWGWREHARRQVLTSIGGYQGIYLINPDGSIVNASTDGSPEEQSKHSTSLAQLIEKIQQEDRDRETDTRNHPVND